MLSIDGSRGEGGGQVLRSSLAFAAATGRPFRMEGIRAGRPKPGLLRQHLTAVRAAAAVCDAETAGAELGSRTLVFRPRAVRAGDYELAVGTAGSTTLVLQTVLVPLLLADGPSTLRLSGGTHNPWAPPFEFLAHALLPLLGRMGASVEVELARHGFHPAGGGEIRARIRPVAEPRPLELLERGVPRELSGEVLLANLPVRIAEAERAALAELLGWDPEQVRVREVRDSAGPGNAVLLRLAFDGVTEVVTGFGEKRVPARRVAHRAAREARRYLAAGAPVGEHLADQLLVPLACLAGGRFRTLELSSHARTNLEVLELFLGSVATCEPRGPDDVLVEVRPGL